MRRWGINTIVYSQLVEESGMTQEAMVPYIKDQGFDFVEYRDEYITGGDRERKRLKTAAKEAGLGIYLSIPSTLFVEDELNEDLEQMFQKAKTIGASQLKLNLGKYEIEKLPVQMQTVKHFIEDYQVRLVVENDQSWETGNSHYFWKFFVNRHYEKVGMCFDTGNFLFNSEDSAIEAAKELGQWVDYIQMKEVDRRVPVAKPHLHEGDVHLKEVLDILPKVPTAIECAYEGKTPEAIQKQISEDMNYLTQS